MQPGFLGHDGRGIGRYAVELVHALARRSDTSLELWFQSGLEAPRAGIPAAAVRRMLPVIPLPLRDRVASQVTIPWAMRSSRADVVHVLAHTDSPAWLPRNVVVTAHDLILDLFPHLYGSKRSRLRHVVRAIEINALKCARTLVTDSASTRADLQRVHGIPVERVHVAHLGVNERFVPPSADAIRSLREKLSLPERFVLYVGGIDPRKNVSMLVDAFLLARQRGLAPDVALLLAGRFEQAPEWPVLRERAAPLGDRFRALGFVHEADLPVLLGAASVFAFPSMYEGFGLPPLEAMACGTPVVSTSAGSLAEVLGDAAWVVPTEDPYPMADALCRLCRDPARAAELGARGRARAEAFTWDACAEQTMAAYRTALARSEA